MADEKKRRESLTESGGSGRWHKLRFQMDSLFEKLKLLNYDSDFYTEIKLKPISRHYFAIQTNPGEQFYLFAALAAWLIRKNGRPFETPQEFDDPNSTIANILGVLKELGATFDFPPNRLKQGHGEHVIFVLSRLAELALKRSNFSFEKPIYEPEPQENEEEEDIGDQDSDLGSDEVEEMIEEDVILSDDDEDEDDDGTDIIELERLKGSSLGKEKVENEDSSKPEGIMESNVDMMEWKLEVERVLPQLKVTVKSDSKDWRSHVEQIHLHRQNIEESLNLTKSQLDKLYSEISHTLEKIGSRERYLNSQLEQLIMEYRAAQERMAQVKDRYNSVSSGITERSKILAQITEELEQVKQEMDERGSNMTDGKPLVNIRKALTKIKAELGQMEVRIGVAQHTLLQAKLKEKGNMQRETSIYTNQSLL